MNQRLLWIPRLAIAAVLGMTLPAKFTGAEDAVALFTALGVEPWGRVALGVVEALLVVGILLPQTWVLAAALTTGLLGGAILSHLTVLGVEVSDDGGALFAMALVGTASGAVITWMRRRELPVVGRWFGGSEGRN